MQTVFEKIIEKLEEEKMSYFFAIANTGDEKLDCAYEHTGDALDKAIEIVKQAAEQYNNGYGTDGGVRMSKAVLVMDMPEKCEKCPLKTLYGDAGYYVCEAGR